MSSSTTDLPAAVPEPGRGERPGLALAAIVSFTLLIGLDSSIVNVALPEIREPMGFTTGGLSWVLNAYTLAFGGLLLLGGRFGDVLGRRDVYVAGIAVFTAASLLAGLARNAEWLIAARGLQGAGAALAAPGSMALIMTNFDGAARMRAIAWFSSTMLAGGVLGLVLGGIVTEWVSWRWVLLVNVPLGAGGAILALRFVKQPPRRAGRFDVPGALTAAVGMTAVVHGFLRASSHGWSDGLTLGSLAAGSLLLLLFPVIESRAPQPVVPLRLFGGGRSGLFLITMSVTAAMFSVMFLVTLFNQSVRGYSPFEAGCAILPMALAQVAFVKLAPKLLPRLGAPPLLVLGTAAVLAGMAWLTALSADSGYLSGVAGPLVLVGLGAGLVFPVLNITLLTGISPADSGTASGLLQTTQWLGGTIGLAVFAAVLELAAPGATGGEPLAHGIARAFLAAAVSAGLGLLLAAGLLAGRPELRARS